MMDAVQIFQLAASSPLLISLFNVARITCSNLLKLEYARPRSLAGAMHQSWDQATWTCCFMHVHRRSRILMPGLGPSPERCIERGNQATCPSLSLKTSRPSPFAGAMHQVWEPCYLSLLV